MCESNINLDKEKKENLLIFHCQVFWGVDWSILFYWQSKSKYKDEQNNDMKKSVVRGAVFKTINKIMGNEIRW